MLKKFKIYFILKVYIWSEKAVRFTLLCTKRCFFAIQGEGGSLIQTHPYMDTFRCIILNIQVLEVVSKLSGEGGCESLT